MSPDRRSASGCSGGEDGRAPISDGPASRAADALRRFRRPRRNQRRQLTPTAAPDPAQAVGCYFDEATSPQTARARCAQIRPRRASRAVDGSLPRLSADGVPPGPEHDRRLSPRPEPVLRVARRALGGEAWGPRAVGLHGLAADAETRAGERRPAYRRAEDLLPLSAARRG